MTQTPSRSRQRAAHTAGPWQVVDGNSTTLYIDDAFGIDGGRDYYLAELRHGDPDELAANARLIAAAPLLLEALQAIAQGSHDPQAVKFARAAIASATGAA